ncbi:uncharacterized protein EI97DRAFT_33128 [Westerdykella ornata]|uniref:Uncharacterized protein n=1 Tax=Westerdykella ornata TaxID=318751 RepID=A0A6A6K0J0_WESOR|nr:uncharacterized protein EI97DRAFT_33128 [Westerdykella ornata]KAF2281566.1 hypothetical protein EI97DRAFT_33128 [Westerdykella ornata]
MRAYNFLNLFFTFSLASATLNVQFSLPRNPTHFFKRQVGYGPEYGDCTTGLTCKDSCWKDYEQCPASTDLVLFCYNPVAGQKCCDDGNGKACDRGYYCTQDSENETWCCPEALSPEACASSFGFPNPLKTSAISSSSSPSPSALSSTSISTSVSSSTSTAASTATSPSASGSTSTSAPTASFTSTGPSTSIKNTRFPSTTTASTGITTMSYIPTITPFINTTTLPNNTVIFFTGGVQALKLPSISFLISVLMSSMFALCI